MPRFFVVLTACAAAVGVLGGCGSSSEKSGRGSAGVTLEAQDNTFKPADLTGRAGTKMTVALKNDGAILHNFTIDGLGVSKDVEAGKTAAVTFTPSAPGTLRFYCKYHQALGMTGTITVPG